MIQHCLAKTYRTVAASAVAVALVSTAASASAQTINTNIFGGTNTGPDSISVSSTVGVGQQNIGTLGPDFTGVVTLPLGLNTTLTESINSGNNGSLIVGETAVIAGVGAGLAGSFAATKTFNDATFIANQFYRFTLTRTANSALSLLSGTNIRLTTSNGGTTTTVLDTSDPNGLLGVVNVLGLFGTGNTASFVFQTPINVSTTSPITVTISGGVTASALNSTFTFTGASLQAVPEPSTWAVIGLGGFGLLAARFRRRSA